MFQNIYIHTRNETDYNHCDWLPPISILKKKKTCFALLYNFLILP